MKKIDALSALGALAQDSRLDIFRFLVTLGPEGAPAGRIADQCGLAKPTLSFHLKEMKFAGLVACRREGRSLIYSANFGAMNDLIAYLTDNCCAGREECLPAAGSQRRVSP